MMHTLPSHATPAVGPPLAAPDAAEAAGRAAGTGPEIRFPQGLPGFPLATRFRLVPLTPASSVLQLVSGDDPELRFLVLAHAEGRLPLAAQDLADARTALGMADARTVVLLMVTVRAPTPTASCGLFVNLRAPIFLDTAQAMAVQHVLPSTAYPVRHPL